MSEKLDILFETLKREHMISLYYNRAMFYDTGFGEIQFWELGEKENFLTLSRPGCIIYFDGWNLVLNEEGKAIGLSLKMGDNEVSSFVFPSKKKIISNHNHFYIDEFAVAMEDALDASLAEKDDWANKDFDYIITGLKHNLGKLKKSTPKEEFQKSCVDLANYAAMGYYLREK